MNVTASSIQAIGDWKSAIGVPLKTAMHVSMDIMGRTGAEACKHALILMAQSASAITRKAKKKRTVKPNPKFRHTITDAQYKSMKAAGRDVSEYFRFTAKAYRQRSGISSLLSSKGVEYDIYANEGDKIGYVKNVGLAKRSWLWTLGQLGSRTSTTRAPIPGVNTVAVMRAPWRHGYQMRNRLSYVTAAMPSGWEQEVERKAGNKIMAQAVRKLETRWREAMNKPKTATIARPDLVRIFSEALAAG